MRNTIVDTFFEPDFHMLQLGFSMSIRISLMEQQEGIFRMESCHLLRLNYQCDTITGDADKSLKTYSRLQWVYSPENGLINHIMPHMEHDKDAY